MREFKNLGHFLKERRNKVGMTQKELAHILGEMNAQFVSNWERGLCAPPSHRFLQLIDVLKVNKESLVAVMLEDSRIVIESKIYKKSKRKSS